MGFSLGAPLALPLFTRYAGGTVGRRAQQPHDDAGDRRGDDVRRLRQLALADLLRGPRAVARRTGQPFRPVTEMPLTKNR